MDSSSESEYDGSEEQAAPVASSAEPLAPQHVSASQFRRVRTVDLDITLRGSPASIQNRMEKPAWRMSEAGIRAMKENIAVTDRDKATDDDLIGDETLCIPLKFTINSQKSSYPFPISLNATGLMPRTITADGTKLFVVPADVTIPVAVNRDVFEPTHFIDEQLFLQTRGSSLKALGNSIVDHASTGKSEAYSSIEIGTLAHQQLRQDVKNGHWDHLLSRRARSTIVNPSDEARTITVPKVIADDLRSTLTKPLTELAKRCINPSEFEVTFERADNPSWGSPQGLHQTVDTHLGSELHGTDAEHTTNHANFRLNQNSELVISATLSYVIGSGQ